MTIEEQLPAQRQVRFWLRLSVEHKERIERAAAATGQTVNSFASAELLKLADEIIAREESRLLSNAVRDKFLALLDNDTDPNTALKAAAKEYKQGQLVGAEYQFEL